MINRLKAAGTAATVALLAWGAFMAMNALSGQATHDGAIPAENLQPDAGSASPVPASQVAICVECMNPAAHEAGATAVALNEDLSARVDTSAADSDRIPELALAGCCTGAHPAPAAGEGDDAVGGSSGPFATVVAAMGGTGMRMSSGTASSGGGGTTGAVTGSGPIGGDPNTSPSEKNDEPVDVLASTGPGSDDKKFVYAPDGSYCVNPVGAYCGASDERGDPGQPDDKTEGRGPDLLAPVDGPTPQVSHLVPPEQDKSKDIPEPLTLALLGVGLAGLRVTGSRSQ
ncbi:MAG TPA: PEP-CTERM sorting domain-containing protein [Noviherbaspirillum sp.]|nr:PEP-CTERM sorting domain-containing protein [Noviherbaspirillum sp.]